MSARRERRISGCSSRGGDNALSNNTTTATRRQQLIIISAEETARQKRSGQARRRMEKAARRENRIAQLEEIMDNNNNDDDEGSSCSDNNNSDDNNNNNNGLTDSERAELEGLLRTRENFEEQYNADSFSEEHVEFKRLHNEAFAALARFCHQQRDRRRNNRRSTTTGSAVVAAADDNESSSKGPNVFYLDGPDTATTLSLIEKHGFDPSCCHVANRHLSTCKILQQHLPEENVIHATATEALSPPPPPSSRRTSTSSDDCNNNDGISYYDNNNGSCCSFSDIDFACYYFDGCGGFVPHIIGMMSAALIRRPEEEATTTTTRMTTSSRRLHHHHHHLSKTTTTTIAVGYSLMGGMNKDLIEKEMDINRALSNIARTRGMRTRHVLDDPWRYGVPAEIAKTEGGTFTSWMILEEEEEEIL